MFVCVSVFAYTRESVYLSLRLRTNTQTMQSRETENSPNKTMTSSRTPLARHPRTTYPVCCVLVANVPASC